MIMMERLAACRLFSFCRFHTPFYDREIEELAVYNPLDEEADKKGILLFLRSGWLTDGDSVLTRLLDRLAKTQAAGLIVSRKLNQPKLTELISKECLDRKLIYGEIDESVSFSELIRRFHFLVPSATNGEVCSYNEILQCFQACFYTGGINHLLEELSFWTGCQTALVIRQDTYVYPRTPVLNEDLFYPASWHKTESPSIFTHVSRFISSQNRRSLLQADLYKNQRPFGQLFLIGKDEPFNKLDCMLLNYASILCTGLDDLNRHSRQIESALGSICRGETPSDDLIELLPASGYALVLSEHTDTPAAANEDTGQEEYLSYLIHYFFPQELCYSFIGKRLLLFVMAKDIEGFGQKLVSVLSGAGKHYYAGISHKYDRSQAVTAFLEATHASKMAELLNYEQKLCFFQELGIYRLFNYPESAWPINQMMEELDELLNHMDKEKKDMLTLTIRTFVKYNFNYQKTADKLYTHVNTIRYRIRLIEDLWNVNLSSDDGRLLFGVLAKLLPLWMQTTDYPGVLDMEELGRV